MPASKRADSTAEASLAAKYETSIEMSSILAEEDMVELSTPNGARKKKSTVVADDESLYVPGMKIHATTSECLDIATKPRRLIRKSVSSI
jgi:hypothetical protein